MAQTTRTRTRQPPRPSTGWKPPAKASSLCSWQGRSTGSGTCGATSRRAGLGWSAFSASTRIAPRPAPGRYWAIAASELDQLARFARDEGRIDDSLSMLAESLRITRDLEMPGQIVENLSRFAETLAVAGRAETAAQLLAAAEALREEIGGSHSWVRDVNEETLTRLRAQLDDAILAKALEQGPETDRRRRHRARPHVCREPLGLPDVDVGRGRPHPSGRRPAPPRPALRAPGTRAG